MATSYLLRCLSAVGPGRAVKLNQLLSAAAPASASPLGEMLHHNNRTCALSSRRTASTRGRQETGDHLPKNMPVFKLLQMTCWLNPPPQKKKKTSQCVSSNQVFDKVNFIHHLFIQVQKKVWDKKLYFLKWDLAKRAAEMATNIMAL